MRLHNQQGAALKHLLELDAKENADHVAAGELALRIAEACDRLEETLLARVSADVRETLVAFTAELRQIAAPTLPRAA